MIVFKTFLKVLNQCKIPILLYTVCLLFFGGFQMTNQDNVANFVAAKPDILLINHDDQGKLTESFRAYLEENSHFVSIPLTKDAIQDALFYRDVNYIVEIPEHFSEDFLAQKDPKIEVQSTGDYGANLAEMLVEKYLHVANIYNSLSLSEEELIQNIEDTLEQEVDVVLTSKLDTDALEKACFYYNFTNYCILAGCIHVICLVLSSFEKEIIRKRTMVSSMDYHKYNRYLLLSNCLFAFVLWFFYVLLSFLLVGKIMFSVHGLFFLFNSFLFTFCSVTLAFFLANLVKNKNAINGIVNVIALGSSFLCGAFVPVQYLPAFVLKIAHVLPSYWFIQTNEVLKKLEVFHFQTLQPIFFNMLILLLFSIVFIGLTNWLFRKNKGKKDAN